MDRGLAQQRLTAAASSRENAWLSSIPHLPHPISKPHLGGSSDSLSLVFGASKNHSQATSPQTLVLQLSCPWAFASLGKLLRCLCELPRRAPGPQQGAALWCQTWKQTDSTEEREEGKAGASVEGACGRRNEGRQERECVGEWCMVGPPSRGFPTARAL